MVRKLMLAVPYLAQDFFQQPLIIKAFLGFGWLCIWVMIFSILFSG